VRGGPAAGEDLEACGSARVKASKQASKQTRQANKAKRVRAPWGWPGAGTRDWRGAAAAASACCEEQQFTGVRETRCADKRRRPRCDMGCSTHGVQKLSRFSGDAQSMRVDLPARVVRACAVAAGDKPASASAPSSASAHYSSPAFVLTAPLHLAHHNPAPLHLRSTRSSSYRTRPIATASARRSLPRRDTSLWPSAPKSLPPVTMNATKTLLQQGRQPMIRFLGKRTTPGSP
jgi:hypothetical protein